jgi:hypothetical protein
MLHRFPSPACSLLPSNSSTTAEAGHWGYPSKHGRFGIVGCARKRPCRRRIAGWLCALVRAFAWPELLAPWNKEIRLTGPIGTTTEEVTSARDGRRRRPTDTAVQEHARRQAVATKPRSTQKT